ncbi:GlsB/YeaQ/YmgE family stress response membrane protein [Paralcaligenes ureilyticus]|uniref:Putative membrane protein YeaQ/YmgE (Transglycosylase-associated protein family) n=1 Tax=Paralcaligenes ureilyticus TaxID=627131 RepID=A0A4R3M3F4_9BURK|nr:GlsB/YeaQ/YmgE family stress response membrane protein [Paralcaligenes ureilyticus]TCT05827.1 putative membrane protein YeaQ/YmgE (transglycosylase-associated protein family) [Paralcaligenes ureilyticus]
MGIISMIIVGFIVGLIARAVMPGEQKLGIIMTTVLGIIGSIVAGYLGHALGLYSPGEGAGWIGSIIGAVIVLFIYGMVVRKQMR